MAEILRNKNQATKFQILAEIAHRGPYIQQRDIARALEVTPQAISDYICQMVNEGLVSVDGHAHYKITTEGVNWVIKSLKELKDYNDFVAESITGISICAAVAQSHLIKGQKVGLEMQNGLLMATNNAGASAAGIAISDAQAGEDIGIKEITGIVQLEIGKITIFKIPNIQNGGSEKINISSLRRYLEGHSIIGAIGIEAWVALKKTDSGFFYFFGVKEAIIESACHGLSPAVVCVEDEIPGLIQSLQDAGLAYDLVDLTGI